MRKYLVIILSFMLLVGCTSETNSKLLEEEIIKPVQVAEIKMTESYRSLTNIGAVTIDESVKVAFKVSGKIEELFVEESDQVKEGELLARLDTSDYQLDLDAAINQLNSAKEAYLYAKETLSRIESLLSEGYSSQDQFDQAKLNLDVRTSDYLQAQVNYRAKENQIKDTKIYSPISGSILSRLNEPGEFVAAGYPVIVVRGDEKVIKVGVPSNEVDLVREGLACNITIDDKRYVGVIREIGEIPDEATRNYEVVIHFSDESVRIGALAKIQIPIEKYEAVLVPIDTIMHKGEDYVYVVEEKIVVKKNINIVGTQGNQAEVIGLDVGDLMIISNAGLVKAGDQVEIKD